MHRLCFALSVAGLVTIASPLARAQEPDTLSAAQRTGFALARLEVGQRVRIRADGVGLVEGVVSSSPNLVMLRTHGSRIQVPAPEADSLWVRGGSAGRGALIGGAVAGGLGLLLGAAFSGCSECGQTDAAALAGGVVVVGAGGALVGALIGAAVPRWQQRTGSDVAGLRVGRQVRIRAGGDGFVQGSISNSPNLVTLRTADGSTIEVPAPGVDSLWVRGTHARAGALIGGAVAGIGLGAVLAYTLHNNRWLCCGLGLGLVGGEVGGVLIGALIGAAVPRWRLRVP